MNTVRIKAYAKVNLTLEIVGQGSDERGAYHALDSLVASVDIFDYIVLKKRKDVLSSVIMHGQGSEGIPPEQNNALKAAEAFSKKFGVNGANITVHKNIPMGAGLGGSSADVCGVLRGMAKLYKIDDENAIAALADELGSDTRYMLKGGFMRMRGRGNELSQTGIVETLHLLLLCPNSSVSSGGCYRAYDGLNAGFTAGENTEKCVAALSRGDINEGGRYLTNALFQSAVTLNHDVQIAQNEAESFSPLGAVMTGSGSAVAALFETKELCEWAKSRYRGKFRAIVTKTVIPQNLENRGWRNPFSLNKHEETDNG